MPKCDEENAHLYERRKYIRLRYSVHAWVEPCNSTGNGQWTRTNNGSVGGVALHVAKRHEPGQIVNLKLEDRKLGLDVFVRGKVIWCQWQPGRRAYEIGIALIQLANQQRDSLLLMFGENRQNERRRYIRIKQCLSVEITYGHWPVRHTEMGSTVNIGLSGVTVRMIHCCQVGEKLSLRIFLPNENEPFQSKGIVRHTNPTNGSEYIRGIEFLEMTEKEKERLAEFLSSLISAKQ